MASHAAPWQHPRMHKPYSSLELLEARIAPAGLVKIAVAKGTVTITGDAMDNEITIDIVSPGVLEITGAMSTMLQLGKDGTPGAGPIDVAGYAGDLKVVLGDGSDSVTLDAGVYLKNVTLDGGAGNNTFSYSNPVVPGTFSILAKGGNDTVDGVANLLVGHDLNIKLGDGINEVTSNASTFSVGGNLTLTAGSSPDNFAFASTSPTTIGGNVVVNLGSNADTFKFQSDEHIQIGGNVSVTGAQKSSVASPGGTAANFTISADDYVGINGNVSVTGKNDTMGFVMGGTNTTTVFGKVTVTTGNSSFLTLNGGQQGYYGDVTFKTKGDTTLNMKANNQFFIGGKLSYTGDKGVDHITIIEDGTIVGSATFNLGGGDGQTITFGGKTSTNISVLGALSVSTSSKTGEQNQIALEQIQVGGKLSVTTGASDDMVKIDDMKILGATQIGMGAGTDSLLIETQGGAYAGATTFVGAFKGTLGDGDDSATIAVSGAGNAVTFTVPSTLDAGKGTDTVNGTPANLTIKNAELPAQV